MREREQERGRLAGAGQIGKRANRIACSENQAARLLRRSAAGLAMAVWMRSTAAPAPSGAAQTPADTAMKSAPAATIGAQFSAVMPPIATQGISLTVVHQPMIDGSA